jgi:hypothetical protein
MRADRQELGDNNGCAEHLLEIVQDQQELAI